MHDAMTLARLLGLIRDARSRLESAISQVPRERMEIPGACGSWSVKDVISHIHWGEHEMVQLLSQRTLSVGSELWDLPEDERNRVVFELNRSRPLDPVLQEEGETYRQLLSIIENLDEADLHDPARIGMLPDWKPYQIIAGNTYRHYEEHVQLIEQWASQKT